MKKTLLATFVVMLFVAASAQSFDVNGYFYYKITSDSTVELTSNPSGIEYSGPNCTIPSSVVHNDTTYTVTSIRCAFAYNEYIYSVTIPNTVTSIGEASFVGCSNLSSINIPNSVTNIGPRAFSNCTSLSTITIPDCVTTIASQAFANCTSLSTITIPDCVTTIASQTFANCTSLDSVNISNSVTEISDSTFLSCTALATITFPDSLTKIGGYAFCGCTSLTSVTLPDAVTNIGSYAFKDCSILSSIDMPGSIDTIGDGAFYNCHSLPSINLPNSVRHIGFSAFCYCSSLNSVAIPDSVTFIGSNAFNDCVSIQSITIPNAITSLQNYLFRGCTALTTINLPNSLKYVGEGVFIRCGSLQSIVIPDSVTFVNSYAFSLCSSLSSVKLSNSLKKLGYRVFSSCYSLSSIIIPESVDTIFEDLFYDCTSLSSIYFLSKTPPHVYDNNFNNCFRCNASLYVYRTSLAQYQTVFSGCGNPIIPMGAQITLSVNDTNMGYVVGDTLLDYRVGQTDTIVTISATAEPGYHFKQWNDGNTDNPRNVVLSKDTSLEAIFEPAEHIVTVLANYANRGVVSGGGTYSYGQSATLTATPNEGYVFSGWDNGETNRVINVHVECDTVITAIFNPISSSVNDVDDTEYIVYSNGNNIHINGAADEAIRIYDINGKLISEIEEASDEQIVSVNVAGVYFVRIKEKKSIKVVVK